MTQPQDAYTSREARKSVESPYALPNVLFPENQTGVCMLRSQSGKLLGALSAESDLNYSIRIELNWGKLCTPSLALIFQVCKDPRDIMRPRKFPAGKVREVNAIPVFQWRLLFEPGIITSTNDEGELDYELRNIMAWTGSTYKKEAIYESEPFSAAYEAIDEAERLVIIHAELCGGRCIGEDQRQLAKENMDPELFKYLESILNCNVNTMRIFFGSGKAAEVVDNIETYLDTAVTERLIPLYYCRDKDGKPLTDPEMDSIDYAAGLAFRQYTRDYKKTLVQRYERNKELPFTGLFGTVFGVGLIRELQCHESALTILATERHGIFMWAAPFEKEIRDGDEDYAPDAKRAHGNVLALVRLGKNKKGEKFQIPPVGAQFNVQFDEAPHGGDSNRRHKGMCVPLMVVVEVDDEIKMRSGCDFACYGKVSSEEHIRKDWDVRNEIGYKPELPQAFLEVRCDRTPFSIQQEAIDKLCKEESDLAHIRIPLFENPEIWSTNAINFKRGTANSTENEQLWDAAVQELKVIFHLTEIQVNSLSNVTAIYNHLISITGGAGAAKKTVSVCMLLLLGLVGNKCLVTAPTDASIDDVAQMFTVMSRKWAKFTKIPAVGIFLGNIKSVRLEMDGIAPVQCKDLLRRDLTSPYHSAANPDETNIMDDPDYKAIYRAKITIEQREMRALQAKSADAEKQQSASTKEFQNQRTAINVPIEMRMAKCLTDAINGARLSEKMLASKPTGDQQEANRPEVDHLTQDEAAFVAFDSMQFEYGAETLLQKEMMPFIRLRVDVCSRIVKRSQYVFCTTLTPGDVVMKRAMEQHGVAFDVVVVEEASLATVPSALVVLTLGYKLAILIGDAQQLSPQLYSSKVNEFWDNYSESILSFFLRKRVRGEMKQTEQFRMDDEVFEFPRKEWYNDQDFTANCRKDNKYKDILRRLSYRRYGLVPNGTQNHGNTYFLINAWKGNSFSEVNSSSLFNDAEAQIAVSWICDLIEEGVDIKDIVVNSFYTAQLKLIKAKLYDRYGEEKDIKAVTVERFQGLESKIVITSLVAVTSNGIEDLDGAIRHLPPFLKDQRRLCVALTRAIDGGIVIGSFHNYLRRDKNSLTHMIQDAMDRKLVVHDDTEDRSKTFLRLKASEADRQSHIKKQRYGMKNLHIQHRIKGKYRGNDNKDLPTNMPTLRYITQTMDDVEDSDYLVEHGDIDQGRQTLQDNGALKRKRSAEDIGDLAKSIKRLKL